MFARVTSRLRRFSQPSTSHPSQQSSSASHSSASPSTSPPAGKPVQTSQYAPPPTPDGTTSPLSPAQGALEPHPGADELPVYLSRAEEVRSEHVFHLRTHNPAGGGMVRGGSGGSDSGGGTGGGKGEPWLTLKLLSSAGQAGSTPLYFDGAEVEGSVVLKLQQAMGVQSIVVLLEGFTRTAGSEQKTFLSLSTPVYPPPGPNDSQASTPAPGKLPPGTHIYPFRIPIPPTVTTPYEGSEVIAPLPPTYSTKGFPAFLEYHLSVVVHRGGLRLDTTLTTPLIYLPRSRPKPASPARQLAYTNLTDPPGPEEDPEGWQALEGVIRGVMFGKVAVEVRCVMHLALPLCYARGTSIPFLLTFTPLTPQSTQAVDLFTQPSSVKLSLEQIVTVGPDALKTRSALLAPGGSGGSNTFGRIVGRGRCVVVDLPPEAGLRMGDGDGDGEGGENREMVGSRRLRGEIPVPRDVKPSFTFVRFTLSYKVNLVVDAVGFVPEKGTGTHALVLSQEVALATDPPRGPKQPTSTFANATAAGRRGSMDAAGAGQAGAETVNLLLMGNQRYMLHHAGGAAA